MGQQQHEGGELAGLVGAARDDLGAAAEAVGRLGLILDGVVGSTTDVSRGEDEGHE